MNRPLSELITVVAEARASRVLRELAAQKSGGLGWTRAEAADAPKSPRLKESYGTGKL
jgi:hypothetical protein